MLGCLFVCLFSVYLFSVELDYADKNMLWRLQRDRLSANISKLTLSDIREDWPIWAIFTLGYPWWTQLNARDVQQMSH